MSRRLLVSTGIASALLLTFGLRTAQAAFPVPGLPQAAPPTLAVTIGADGTVSNPRVIQSIPALDAARHWTFRPGTREGTPVEVETEITFAFELKD